MHLFVIRHGIAEDPALGQDDATRALTSDGRKKFRQVVRGLRTLELSFSRVLTSPWLRAAQTAKLLAPLSDHHPSTTELLCQSPRSELLALLAEGGESTALVGHEPWLSELVAWLAFGDTKHSDAIEIKKGAAVWLDGPPIPGGMRLRALLPPKVTRGAR
ncbi:MAG: histidine phosphatase family protein [Myxococcales bacterium]|nr:histidine phosphatase family protein [Myxococcales bacterium]